MLGTEGKRSDINQTKKTMKIKTYNRDLVRKFIGEKESNLPIALLACIIWIICFLLFIK